MSAKFLLSPTESDLAKALGDEAINSPLCEERGADILLYTSVGLFGFQRKRVPHDFLSSFTDGRFTRLLPLLTKNCVYFRLIKEGKFKYWPDQTVDLGMMAGHKRIPSRFTRTQVHGMLNDIDMLWGVPIRETEDVDDTVRFLKSVRTFMEAKTHLGTYNRPKVQGAWYVPTAEETQLWILQGFSGIGPTTADAIIKHFGRIPLRWTCTPEELSSVGRISIKRATELISILNSAGYTGKISDNPVVSPFPVDTFATLRSRLGKGS